MLLNNMGIAQCYGVTDMRSADYSDCGLHSTVDGCFEATKPMDDNTHDDCHHPPTSEFLTMLLRFESAVIKSQVWELQCMMPPGTNEVTWVPTIGFSTHKLLTTIIVDHQSLWQFELLPSLSLESSCLKWWHFGHGRKLELLYW